jgi:membrane protein implicated in regulation of membrane protease activity
MQKNTNLNYWGFFILIVEVSMRFLGKVFSYVLPVAALLMGIMLACRIFYLPDWFGKILFFLLSIILFILAAYLFKKRKSLDLY